MKIRAARSSALLVDAMAKVEKALAKSITDIMTEETVGLKDDYRNQVRQAGMGNRLATTWRSDVYPRAYGQSSLNPTGYVQSLASPIVDAFSRGASIRPVRGGKWLWIPTKNVPRAKSGGSYSSSMTRSRGRGRGSAMSPQEVELHFNAELQVVIEGGRGFAFIDVVSGIAGGHREATAGRLKGRRGMAPRKKKPILMFNLVRGVRMPKLFDLDGPAKKRAENVARRIATEWG